jgi:hypothetical protein
MAIKRHVLTKYTFMKISRLDFTFFPLPYGHFNVMYTSPVTRKNYFKIISNIRLIDAIKHDETPKKCDLIELKRTIKS